MQNRYRGIANVTGWIAAPALVAVHGYARYASASSPAAASEPRWRLPSQKTGNAPRETNAICANASASGDGHKSQSGARSARNGSTCPPRRTTCSPVVLWVTSSGRPCAVLQTACTMFPRSKRPSRKFV